MEGGRPSHSADDDRELVARCVAGDRGAWGVLVDRFSRLVLSVVGRTVRRYARSSDDDLVDDLFGQVFLALYDHDCRRLGQWGGRCSLASWVRLVTASVTLDTLRRRRDHLSLDADGPGGADRQPGHHLYHLIDDDPSPLVRVVELERAALVRRALDELSPDDRDLLLQIFERERSPGEVAGALGLAPGVVYTRKNRALARLRERVLALDAIDALEAGVEGPKAPSGGAAASEIGGAGTSFGSSVAGGPTRPGPVVPARGGVR